MKTTAQADELTASLQSDVRMIQCLVAPLKGGGRPTRTELNTILKVMFLLREDAHRALLTALELHAEMDR